MDKTQLYNEVYELREQLTNLHAEYWHLYSDMSTWYFWFNSISIVIPLIILYFAIDRERLFEIAFYGYSAHILWATLDSALSMHNYFTYPHTISYLIPAGVNVTAVLFPVVFMLLYQYCTNKGKNFYLYAIIVSFIFAYGFGGFALITELGVMHKGMNLTYLFLIDIAIALISLWATKLFLKVKKTNRKFDF